MPAGPDTRPKTLLGRKVSLVPLDLNHLEPLCEHSLDPELWKWVPTKVTTRSEMKGYIERALREQAEGLCLPFAILEHEASKIVGSTRLRAISRRDRSAEIGWTWVSKPWQRTVVNTEAKLLLLTHAFDSWGCVRVEFTTDARNEQSRLALLRIGAHFEGILRKNRLMPDGNFRDTAIFSITEDDWSGVQQSLLDRLTTGRFA